jgi:hypothetical protein
LAVSLNTGSTFILLIWKRWLTHMGSNTCLSGGNVFYSHNRLLFWACMFHVKCLCVSFERRFGETMWSQEMLLPWQSHQMFSAIFSFLRDRALIGDTTLQSSRKL